VSGRSITHSLLGLDSGLSIKQQHYTLTCRVPLYVRFATGLLVMLLLPRLFHTMDKAVKV
jgi:hypothetical protein